MIEKLSNIIIKFRFPVILVIITITVFSGYELKNFTVRNNMAEWLPDDDKVAHLFNQIGDEFSTNSMVSIIVKPKSGSVFSYEFLDKVKKFTGVLKEKKEIFNVVSITNISNIQKIEDGIEVGDFVDEVPIDQSELNNLREYALSKEEFVDTVISGDAEFTNIVVSIRSDEDEVTITSKLIVPMAEEYLGDVADLNYAGMPADMYWANTYAVGDMARLVPLVVLLIALILLVTFRNFRSIILPLTTAAFAVVWAFAFKIRLGSPIDIISSVIPVMLIAIGSAYGIHIINSFYQKTHNGGNSREVAAGALSAVLAPVLLSGLTTVIGFASFVTAKLSLMLWFGVFTAFGVGFSMIIALTFLPAILSFSKGKKTIDTNKDKPGKTDFMQTFLTFIGNIVVRRKVPIVIICGLVTLLGITGIPRIKKEVNFVEYFPPGSPPRTATMLTKDHFGGAYPIILYYEGYAKDPAILKELQKAEYYVYSITGTSKPLGVSDFICEMNWLMNDSYSIPDTDSGVANLWLFIDGREIMKQMVTDDEKKMIGMGKASMLATDFMRGISEQLDKYLSEEVPRELVESDVSSLPDSKTKELRMHQAEEIGKQISWIMPKYTTREMPEASKIAQLVKDTVEKPVNNTDRDFASNINKLFEKYIFDTGFELYLDEGLLDQIYSESIQAVENGKHDSESFLAILKEIVPPDVLEEEDWAIESIVETFMARTEEAFELTVIERIWKNISNIIPDDAEKDKHFVKKARGIISTITDRHVGMDRSKADDMGVLAYTYREVPFHMEHNGMPSVLTRLDKYLFNSQVQSLAIAMICVFVLMLIQFRSFALGLISLAPIIFTISVSFGMMGYFGINLDYVTMMIAALSIGIGIDYTIHYMHRVRSELDDGDSLETAVVLTNISVGRAILSNTVAMVCGFLVLLFSNMYPLRSFGWVTALTMLLTAFGALTIVPAIMLLHKKLKTKED